MLLGVDVGGTFTDAVLAHGDRLLTVKVPSTPRDQSQGVFQAVARGLERLGASGEDIDRFAHGTTVATNALLEGESARTVLIATDGFSDLIELGRQNRPELYRLCAERPAPLVEPGLRFGAPERMTPDGPLVPLQRDDARRLAAQVAESQAESIAVALIHSYRHPEHEQMVAAALARALPGAHA